MKIKVTEILMCGRCAGYILWEYVQPVNKWTGPAVKIGADVHIKCFLIMQRLKLVLISLEYRSFVTSNVQNTNFNNDYVDTRGKKLSFVFDPIQRLLL